MNKLQMAIVIEEHVSTDVMFDLLKEKYEDEIQSIDIASFEVN